MLTDPVLAEIEATVPLPILDPSGDVFHDLIGCLVEQQHPARSTKRTYAKALERAGQDRLTPGTFDAFERDGLAGIKLSGQKQAALAHAAEWFSEHAPDWPAMDDADVRRTLLQLKGVGAWTADVLLIWTLGREDVIPLDDYHLKKAMAARYGLATGAGMKARMREIASAWRPNRSLGTRYLLAWTDWQRELAR
ncbi:MAG: hypothetical protein AAGI52_04035 [Bacteroidota bacterium]